MDLTPLKCPVCNSTELSDLERVDVFQQHRRYAPADEAMQASLDACVGISGGEYQMRRCKDCGLEFATPLKAPPGEWYDLVYKAVDLYPIRRWEFTRVLDEAGTSDFLVEFGCGSGAFLRMCKERAVRAMGFDFSGSAVEQCRQLGLEARKLSVSAAKNLDPNGKPSMIVAFHVLEHLDAPLDLLACARATAGPGTRLWISVPGNLRPSSWFGETDLLDQPPHHMTRWCERALATAGEKTGWHLRHMHYEPLGLKTALWSISTNCGAYQKLKNSGLLDSKLCERTARWLMYPWALIRRLTAHRSLAGFTMLAEFVPRSTS